MYSNDFYKIAGKKALITGAAEGIGKEFAKELIDKNAVVVIFDIQDDKGEATSKELGPNCFYYHCDISDFSEVKEVYEKVKREVGKIDILINNAGTAVRKSLNAITEEVWDKIHNINTKPACLLSVLVAEDMKMKRWGRIINISSVRTEFFDDKHSGYSITKTGVEAVTRCLASEYGKYGITVNTLSLGLVRTSMTEHYWEEEEFEEAVKKLAPVQDTIYPSDVAKVAAFICSDFSRFINGEKIHVDGGSFLWKASV